MALKDHLAAGGWVALPVVGGVALSLVATIIGGTRKPTREKLMTATEELDNALSRYQSPTSTRNMLLLGQLLAYLKVDTNDTRASLFARRGNDDEWVLAARYSRNPILGAYSGRVYAANETILAAGWAGVETVYNVTASDAEWAEAYAAVTGASVEYTRKLHMKTRTSFGMQINHTEDHTQRAVGVLILETLVPGQLTVDMMPRIRRHPIFPLLAIECGLHLETRDALSDDAVAVIRRKVAKGDKKGKHSGGNVSAAARKR
ncbi:hypothetical protein [Gryllotalpicola kribbensis]|uniref:hypothetical protein n=1 Tax=Gryllotalpicola kribbensis TaxID=993084 RepID=UPI0031DEEDBE